MRSSRIAALAALVVIAAACSSPSASEDLSVSVDPESGTIAIEAGDATTTSEPAVLVGGADGEPTPDDGVPSIPEVPDVLEPLEGEVDGEGVLIAAIVVATGDVEAALDEGVVTPAEVEAAIGAIADGTLSEWVGP